MKALRGLLRAFFWIISIFLIWQVAIRLLRKARPFPMPAALAAVVLESPLRKRWVSAETVVRRIGLQPGQTVLEVGAGTGYIATAAARAVGEAGKVYAIDVEPEMVERLRQRKVAENLGNIEVKLADGMQLDFADDTFDAVYFVTSLGEMPDKHASLWEAYRVLKPGGTLSVSEMLLDPDYMLRGTVIRLAEETGFYLLEEHGNLFAYTVNFRKPARQSDAA